MNSLTKITAAALAALTLSACVEDQTTRSDPPPMREASGIAETACMQAVNRNYGGNVRDLRVASSEFSQANSTVLVDAVGVRGGQTSERWRCLASNDGKVEDLAVVQ